MYESTSHFNSQGIYKPSNLRKALLASAIASAISLPVYAQGEKALEEVVVTGTRATIQDQINLKRMSTEIVDGMSADEIGELPALSIGEALETITGAASHRENGGATEISVRGLGPFLGTTVVNGREATNGSGNRAVNFSIFPSEMFNSIAVHKTQSAKYIEGAVSGQIHLDTRRPIDYGKERLQLGLKGSMHPDDKNIDGQQEIGYRGTASYINSWETDAGTIGISIGGQKRDDSNPEAEAFHTTGSGRFEGCLLDSFDRNAQPVDTSGRCHDGSAGVTNDDIQGIIDSDPNINSVADIPWAYIPRDRSYRQNTTDDNREALFGAIQWQPNDKLDIMVDFQTSERDQRELRRDLVFGATQNNITDLVSDPTTGIVESFVTDTDINAVTTDFTRFEEYKGAGFNIAYQLTDDLKISFDASYSDTERTETDVEVRLGSTVDGATQRGRDEFLVAFDVNADGTDGLALPTILCQDGGTCDASTLGDYDVTDPTFFTAGERARLRAREQVRENTIQAYRLDLNWNTENLGFIHSIDSGIRFSTLEYLTTGGNRNEAGFSLFEDEDLAGIPNGDRDAPEALAAVTAAANNCGLSSFPESGFLSESRGSNDLITVASGIGTGNTYATFDHGCLLDELLVNYGGASAVGFQTGITSGTIDVTEDTMAAYVQANYESELGGKSVRGNFGLRVVKTEVESIGYRTPLTVVTEDDGMGGTAYYVEEVSGAGFEQTKRTNSYTEFLPSLTFIMDLSDELVFRAGAFKGMSRPDPHSFGAGRSVETNDSSDSSDPGFASLEEAVQGVDANGNPKLEPLTSLNLDLALEWYVNDDTMLTAGVYWKEFKGGFESVFQQETFIIDGNPVVGSVRTTQVSDDDSELSGLELTATHAFTYLPGFASGFGVKFSYNYADSNFEFEDGFGGDGIDFDDDGNATPLIGVVPPAGLFGLSRHTQSSQLYWQNDDFNIALLWKTRSQYFQGFGRDTSSRIRYVDDNQSVDLRMSYDVTDNVKLSLEALNILSEPRRDFRPIDGSTMATLEYGPRVFFGVQGKF
ncbi:MAG: TonB-dependent receptor [Gammaproteobacteria bacterium]|nr:TonB-dependent receptor [Gammaproteobacteria bacterium]